MIASGLVDEEVLFEYALSLGLDRAEVPRRRLASIAAFVEPPGKEAPSSAELARRFAAGGRLFAFGNGGSSTDVATLVALFARPPAGNPLPALSLSAWLSLTVTLLSVAAPRL